MRLEAMTATFVERTRANRRRPSGPSGGGIALVLGSEETSAMSRDYYSEAEEIARSLDAEGLQADARTLRDAIRNGSTGSEIFMALRWNLQQIDKRGSAMNLGTRAKIRELARALGDALR